MKIAPSLGRVMENSIQAPAISWDSPSEGPSGSMPLGNGDIGLNVWTERSGDILMYLSKTDAWDENASLLKIGRLRLSFSPNPLKAGSSFRQTLKTIDGCVEIEEGDGAGKLSVRIWADAKRPVVRIETRSESPVELKVAAELWRNAERRKTKAGSHGAAGTKSADETEISYPDETLEFDSKNIAWLHRNKSSCWSSSLELQDMAGWISKGEDPLLGRCFGALVRGEGLAKDGALRLKSEKPEASFEIGIHVLTAISGSSDEWARQMDRQAAESDSLALEEAFEEHRAWWRAFWSRSWIRASGSAEAEAVSLGYALQRFVNACGGRGAQPIKFNGSIFTVDGFDNGESLGPDYRRWGGGYWFQNTRLPYWSMLMSGDFDLMEPFFKMYLDALPLASERAKSCFGIDGAAVFPETMTFWGSFLNSNYGFAREGLKPGLSENAYIRRYWQGMLELLAILLDAHSFSGGSKKIEKTLLTLAPPFIRFFREQFKERDGEGKVLFAPAQALETWHKATNPLPEIAGLRWTLDGLLALPEASYAPKLREEWSAFRNELPPLPSRSYCWEKRRKLIPALQYDECMNSENVALYAVFPYRLFGVGKPNLDVGAATWEDRPFKATGGWRQDAIQAALLGLAEEAKAAVAKNFSGKDPGSRFPAFWGPNFDWTPDQDHGCVACVALQRMIVQRELPPFGDGKLRLLPAWPKDWNLDFKLHVAGGLSVEGSFKDGKLEGFACSHELPEGSVEIPKEMRI